MISEIKTLFKNLKPTAGLLNLPIYDWKSIYTTNYDDLGSGPIKFLAEQVIG